MGAEKLSERKITKESAISQSDESSATEQE